MKKSSYFIVWLHLFLKNKFKIYYPYILAFGDVCSENKMLNVEL